MQHSNSKRYFKIGYMFISLTLGNIKKAPEKKKKGVLGLRACEEENSPFCKCYHDAGRVRCDQNKSVG